MGLFCKWDKGLTPVMGLSDTSGHELSCPELQMNRQMDAPKCKMVYIWVLQSTWQLISKSLFIIFRNIWMGFLANGQETHLFYETAPCRYLQPLELSCAELQTNERTHQNAKCIERKKKSNSRKLAAVSRPISQCIPLIRFCSKTCEINHVLKLCGA
jgi:hypothetical protein